MTDETVAKTDGDTSQKGGFFAIDRRSWERVCSCGMNAAVAYLVLAQGTAGNNITTWWSTHAIEKYTGISRSRARNAIKKLIDENLILKLQGGTKPKYEIRPWGDLPGNTPPARKAMTKRQQLVFDLISGGKQPSGDQRAAAYELVGKGWLTNNGLFQVETQPEKVKPDWVWLPNELVTGAAEEEPPVELLRQTQDPMALRLFIDFYHAQNLHEDGGISREFIWQEYERKKISQRAQFTIWGFCYKTGYVAWEGPTVRHYREELTDEEEAQGENHAIDYFRRQSLLTLLGLIEWIPHLIESNDKDAEIIHPYGIQNGDSLEDRLGDMAHEAARALLTDSQCDWTETEDYRLAPVPHHFQNVQMVGIARLRYRPHTKLTAAWYADLVDKGNQLISRYEQITAEAEKTCENILATG